MTLEPEKFELKYEGVAPFPRERFLQFLSKLKVQSKDYGLVPFKLLGSQRYILDELCDALSQGITTVYILKARQLGASTFFLALDLFWAFDHKGLLGVFITHKEDSRDDFRSAIEVFFAEIPKGFFVKYVRHNRNLLILKNGSKFRYLIAGTSENRKGGLGRSGAANYVHATECAFYGSGDDVAEFRSQTSSLYPHRLQIYETTANGFNWFADEWEIATKDPTKRAVFVGWWRDERNQFPTDHPYFAKYMPDGINSTLTALERKRVREVRQEYGFEISLQAIAWYRWKLESETGGDQATMDQEHPWCVVGSTRVGTAAGILTIQDIVDRFASGMPVLCTHGRVVDARPTGTWPTFRIRTKMGYELVATGNHPLGKQDGGFILAAESQGSQIKLSPPLTSAGGSALIWWEGPTLCEIRVTEELARLVGLFMGDGSMQVNAMSISCDAKDQDVVAECVSLIQKVFGLTPQIQNVRGCSHVRITSKLIYETFKKMGLTRSDTGKTQRNVHVPDFIWKAPKNIIKQFLRGVFEADGFNGFDTPRVVLFSRYEAFLKDIQLLLLAFGITCRRTQPFKQSKSFKGKVSHYIGNELQLRKAESIAFNNQIGFISARKNLRFLRTNRREATDRSSFAMELIDTIVAVEPAGTQPVFNLTIEDEHIFDAGGILTHNTADDAFQATGSKFFSVEALTECTKEAKRHPFQAFRYRLSHKFEETRVAQVRDPRAELRIWEDTSPFGYYVIGADPAYGSSDEADRSVASVWRCYSDQIVQVAEYASPTTSTYQFAWVLAHLCGYYGATYCMPVLEITGPGQAVFDELQKIQKMAGEIRPTDEAQNIRNILKNMRHFFYKRIDSLSGGIVYQWRSSEELKQRIMNQLKNGIELGRMQPRSVPLCEEMRRIVNDEGHIAAEGRAKDDRVIGAALAYQGWNMWVQPRVKAQGLSMQRAAELEQRGGTADPLDRVISNYLKRANIKVPTT